MEYGCLQAGVVSVVLYERAQQGGGTCWPVMYMQERHCVCELKEKT